MNENESKEITEKRRFTRFDCSITVFFKNHKSEDSKESYGMTGNLSRGGLKVFESTEMKVGSLLDLVMQIPDDPHPVTARGEVMWINKTNDETPKYCFGINFIGINAVDKFRILEYVYNHWLDEKVTKLSFDGQPAF
jgi:hypothetical protein